MKALRKFGYSSSRFAVSPVSITLLGCALAAGVWVGKAVVNVSNLRDEVQQLQSRVDHRTQGQRQSQRAERSTPEDRKAYDIVAAQLGGAARATHVVLPVISTVEQAWTPEIALLSLTLRATGTQALVVGDATDLSQVYLFTVRLRGKNPDMKVMLLRHSTKSGDATEPVQFSLSLEQP